MGSDDCSLALILGERQREEVQYVATDCVGRRTLSERPVPLASVECREWDCPLPAPAMPLLRYRFKTRFRNANWSVQLFIASSMVAPALCPAPHETRRRVGLAHVVAFRTAATNLYA